jgi:hypothetical protein
MITRTFGEEGPAAGRNPTAMPIIANWKNLDQLLAAWEFRAGPTPWVWLESKGLAP